MSAKLAVALFIAGAAAGCGGGGGGGGFAQDAAGGGAGAAASGGTGGSSSDGSGGTATDAGSDATIEDSGPIDPAQACEQPLDVTPYACTFEQAQIAPALGGEIPEGIYDRTVIVSPLPPPATCDSRSSLLLTGGAYKLQFNSLGGPSISGGAYTVNSATGQLFLTPHCGDHVPGYFYEYVAAEQKLTLFPDNYTGWVYVLRK